MQHKILIVWVNVNQLYIYIKSLHAKDFFETILASKMSRMYKYTKFQGFKHFEINIRNLHLNFIVQIIICFKESIYKTRKTPTTNKVQKLFRIAKTSVSKEKHFANKANSFIKLLCYAFI